LSSAGQGVRAHAVAVPSSPLGTPPLGPSPLASPRRVSGADSPRSDAQAAVAAGAAGNPFAEEHSASGSQGITAERSGSGGLHMRWQPPPGQRQQQQQQQQWLDEDDQVGDTNMSQLKVRVVLFNSCCGLWGSS
jgi:hypothetical protein